MSSRIDREGHINYDIIIPGRRFCGNTGHRDKTQAATWIADFKAKIRREMANEVIGIKPEVTLTCQALLHEWLAHHAGKPVRNVKAENPSILRHLCFVFGWGVKTERIPRLPFRKLRELIEQEPVRTFLRPEQVRPFPAHL